MSKLAAVADRLAQTRRWLDQEADRLAARLDQLEKRAPVAIQNAHRILDEQQRELEATEQMVQQWLSASAETSSGSNKPRAPQHAGTSPSAYAQPKQPSDLVPGPLDPAYRFLDEQQKDVGRLERALQTLATEIPEPQTAGASPLTRAQPKPSSNAAAATDSRRLLDEPKDEGGLERALQTLANKLQPPQPAAASTPARPRLLDELQKSDDATKPAARKLGVVRVA